MSHRLDNITEMICEACGAENPIGTVECEFCRNELNVIDEMTNEYVNGLCDTIGILDVSDGGLFDN